MAKRLFSGILFFSWCFWGLKAQTFTPGNSYFGTNLYIEYLAGNMPLLITAPHGGLLAPASIPDRSCSGCSTVNDFNTQELARALAMSIHARTGCWPHVVFNKLHRRKLDANRDLTDAADGNPDAEKAWEEFHQFAETAREEVLGTFGKGIYIDLHGHAHDIQRLELGYLLTSSELALPEDGLNAPDLVLGSSIRHLSSADLPGLNHAELLHGTQSLGAMLEMRGYPATPSFDDPYPLAGEDYFNGGYNTARYGSADGKGMDGIQIECNRHGVRDSLTQVQRFADTLAVVLLDYLKMHYFGETYPSLCASDPVAANNASDFYELYPNPYCFPFYIKKTAAAPPGNWTYSIHDFYGNLLLTNPLPDENPVEIRLKQPKNVWVVLRRDGQVVDMQAIFRYCR